MNRSLNLAIMENNLTGKEHASAIRSAIWGFVVGDALGVPFEFTDRQEMSINPCTTMTGYGTHDQPPGTWSDDSSMMLCVLENLLDGGNAKSLAKLFLAWYREGYMTAGGCVFDIGITTSLALNRLEMGHTAASSGIGDEASCGNGSLMRCLPYAFGKEISKSIFDMVTSSRITHTNALCHECCIFYVKLARALIDGHDKQAALKAAGAFLRYGWRITDDDCHDEPEPEKARFRRLFDPEFPQLPSSEIRSGGFVIETLEAAVWCFTNSDSYAESVLKAVNLGRDTDTIAALTGGLSGIYYGHEAIPAEWLEMIRNKECVQKLVEKAAIHRY
jgi:ADP-ribosyl-[dinitrogen reductase] hydrolase